MFDLVTIQVIILHETELAVMVENLEEEKVWIPKSQIEIHEDETGSSEIEMPEWLAIDKELI